MVIIALMTSRIFVSDKCPAVERIRFLSAVNILLGRIKLLIGRLPEMKSFIPQLYPCFVLFWCVPIL